MTRAHFQISRFGALVWRENGGAARYTYKVSSAVGMATVKTAHFKFMLEELELEYKRENGRWPTPSWRHITSSLGYLNCDFNELRQCLREKLV